MRHLGHSLVIAATLAGAAGCRHADLNRELVERELRLQEDELYRAHDEIAERERRLEFFKSENETLKRELQQARATSPLPAGIVPDMPPAPTGDPPRRSPRNGGAPSIDLTPPTIELPGGQGPGANEPQSKDASQGSSWRQSRGVRQASFEEPQNESHQPKPRPKGDRRVTQIVLDRRLTGGYNADRLLGDDGVTVFIEPRDEDDSLVHRAGEVSVVVIDPALSGAKARVARWDFSAAEIERHFQKTALGEGIMLKLEWPADLPLHERLMLFVRFISAGGDVLEASQPVLVDLGKADDDEADGSQLPKAHSTSWSPDR